MAISGNQAENKICVGKKKKKKGMHHRSNREEFEIYIPFLSSDVTRKSSLL
jgi:hypothetical protein